MEKLSNGDITISYRTKGSGQAVLLLHGFPDTSALWTKQVEALVSQNFQVVTPDLRGYGASSKPPEIEKYKMTQTAEDMYRLLDHLSLDKVILVGHDWGAFLAWHMIDDAPQRFLKLAVLSVGHGLSFFPAGGLRQRQLSWYMLLFQDPAAEKLLQADDWALWKTLMGDHDPDLTENHIKNMSGEGALTAGLNWYRANFQVQAFAMTKALPRPKIKVPVLGLWSTGDKFLTEEQMTASEQYVEDGLFQYKRIDNAGHWMQYDAAAEVSNALISFFQQKSASL